MSSVSTIQLEANQQNAKRSTGPRTDQGKVRSSRNAMKFGIFSSQVLLPGEDAETYESFRAGMYRRLRPVDELERMLADRVVLAGWKLRRVQAAEAFRYDESREKMSDWERVNGKLAKVPPVPGKVVAWHGETFERLTKHEAALERSMYRAMADCARSRPSAGRMTPSPNRRSNRKTNPFRSRS